MFCCFFRKPPKHACRLRINTVGGVPAYVLVCHVHAPTCFIIITARCTTGRLVSYALLECFKCIHFRLHATAVQL